VIDPPVLSRGRETPHYSFQFISLELKSIKEKDAEKDPEADDGQKTDPGVKRQLSPLVSQGRKRGIHSVDPEHG
jgi:hypothetical protein